MAQSIIFRPFFQRNLFSRFVRDPCFLLLGTYKMSSLTQLQNSFLERLVWFHLYIPAVASLAKPRGRVRWVRTPNWGWPPTYKTLVSPLCTSIVVSTLIQSVSSVSFTYISHLNLEFFPLALSLTCLNFNSHHIMFGQQPVNSRRSYTWTRCSVV